MGYTPLGVRDIRRMAAPSCAQAMSLTEPVGGCIAQGTCTLLSPLAPFQRYVNSGLNFGIMGGKMTRLYEKVSWLLAGCLDSPLEGRP